MMSWRLWSFVGLSLVLAGACGGSDDAPSPNNAPTAGGAAGTAGSGTAGSGTAGSGQAGSGTAGSGQAGSGQAGSGQAGQGQAGSGGAPSLTIGGDRPVTVHLPDNYDPSKPAPLLVMLHGRSVSGDIEDAYLGLTGQASKDGFVYIHPSGTTDAQGQPFWNATDACCNFFGSTVDDEGYLMGLIDEIASKWSIDPKRVYLMGHSNGGFMSYRLACHHAERFAAIAVLAGEMYKDLSQCQPANPVSVLHIQGTADATILYNGGSVAPGTVPEYPSAQTSVADWAGFDGCDPTGDTSAPALDIEASIAGAETTVTRYQNGCKSGSAVELWSITGGAHIPTFGPAFLPTMTGWLLAHTRP
jgi:polyhydroxybutyrate depolymerase